MNFLSVWSLVATAALWAAATAQAEGIDYISGACVGVLSRVYTWGECPIFPLNCVCANANFTLTVVGCVDILLKDLDPAEADARRAAVFDGIVASCPNVTMAELQGYSTGLPSLTPLGCVSKKGAFCAADRAFLPTATESRDALKAYTWGYIDSYTTCWRYGGASLVYWAGIILVRAVVFWVIKLFPGLSQQIGKSAIVTFSRRHLTLPPMFSRYHSQPYSILKLFTLNLPTREQSVIVTGFLGTCLGLNFGYKMYTPTYIFQYTFSRSYSYYLGFISGYMILFHLPLLVIFAGRNNILLPLTGWPQDTFVVFHKWVGRIIVMETIIHTVAFTIYEVEYDNFIMDWMSAYWNWGVVALVAACLMIVQAVHMLRKLAYETFLVVHTLSAVFFIVGSYYHVMLLEGSIQFIWATVAVWAFERASRIARVLLSNPFATALIESHNNTVLEFTINYSRAWKFDAGQHIFIHLLTPSCFWESHPFSVMAPVKEEENGSLKLFVTARGGMTRKLLKRTIANGGALNAHVWIDGPYGESHNLETYSEAMFVAGGSGITAVFAYIQTLIRTNAQTRISLYWAVSDDSPLTWFKHQIDFMIANNVSLHIHIANDNAAYKRVSGLKFATVENASTISTTSSSARRDSELDISGPVKMDLAVIGSQAPEKNSLRRSFVFNERLAIEPTIRAHIMQSKGSLVVVSCGPGGFNDDSRNAVASCLTTTHNFVKYVEESYSW